MKLTLALVDLATANAFVRALHRHHAPVIGHKFSLGAVIEDKPVIFEKLVGVSIVGRPVAQARDDGYTLEVTRLCTDGTRNACSFLYGASARAAFALGYSRIGTYTQPDESGSSLRASGWTLIGERGNNPWKSDRPGRHREDKRPPSVKLLWELANPAAPPRIPRMAEVEAARSLDLFDEAAP
jgi:hypothetical protein